MKKQNVRTLSLIVCTFTYLLIGAAIFDSIESEEEQKQKEALEKLEEQLKSKYNISRGDFLVMEEVITLWQPFKAGMPWKFAGSFYYATTVLTTIGYGHSTPKTDGGKFFTMVYAMIGIPLGLLMFNSIGERLNNFSSIVINRVRRLLKAKQPETTEMDLILVASALSFIVVFTGAATFSHYEGWTYFNAIYYCFVTLTTIGFGDLVALQQDNALETKPEYVTFALFFIMFGLAIIAASLNLMVLKFMMLNTEDEKRDEQEAIQAAAHTVRLDGDVILQQNDVIHWQAQEMDIDEEVRSVCSCNGCYPLHRLVYSSHQRPGGVQSGNEIWAPTIPAIRRQLSVSAIEEHLRPMSKKKPSCDHSSGVWGPLSPSKAESVHDLRRSTMCSMLRLPSASPLLVDSRILKCPSCDARIVQELLANHKIEASYEERRRSFELSLSPWDDDRISTGSDLNIFSRLWRTISQGGTMVEDTFSQPSPVNNRRYSFVLDEIESLKPVPKEKNLHYHKRVSL